MNEKEYLKNRLDDQIQWYSNKSKKSQGWFKRLRLVEITSAATIPFLSGLSENICYSEWIIGALGINITVAVAVTSLYKLHENWIKYRTTCEQLKHEKYLYLTDTKPYDIEGKLNLLVQRVESLISKENSNWAQTQEKKDKTHK